MSKSFMIFLLASGGLFFIGAIFAGGKERIQPTERLQKLMTLDRPLVIAHRGYSMAAPENTLPAFRLGILADADLVELDYYHSSDDVQVIFHDTTLNRTSDAGARWNQEKIPLTSKSLAELRELDAGSWFDSLYKGVGIPTLDESLDLIQPETITLIERKHGEPRPLVDLLRKKGMLNDVVVQAFDWEYLAGCHREAPGLVLGALGPPRRKDGSRYPVDERVLNSDFLDRIEAAGAQVVGWNRQVTQEAVHDAQSRGLRVWIYTVNDLDTARNFLEMGVDGIISDNPAMVWKAIALHNDRRGK